MHINHQFLTEVLHYCPESGCFTYRLKRGQKMPGDLAGYEHTSGYRYIGFRGVSYHHTGRSKPKWRVRISPSQGVRISIGNFDSLDAAIAARIEAENKYYGEYAPSRGCEK